AKVTVSIRAALWYLATKTPTQNQWRWALNLRDTIFTIISAGSRSRLPLTTTVGETCRCPQATSVHGCPLRSLLSSMDRGLHSTTLPAFHCIPPPLSRLRGCRLNPG